MFMIDIAEFLENKTLKLRSKLKLKAELKFALSKAFDLNTSQTFGTQRLQKGPSSNKTSCLYKLVDNFSFQLTSYWFIVTSSLYRNKWEEKLIIWKVTEKWLLRFLALKNSNEQLNILHSKRYNHERGFKSFHLLVETISYT